MVVGATVRWRWGGSAATATFIVKPSAVALTGLALLSACVTLPRGAAVPASATLTAQLAECSQCRYFPSLDIEPLLVAAMRSNERERAAASAAGSDASLSPAAYLAISGGADSGPFGAGLLVGWTQKGDRPTFKVVTGVSAGALIAPFAFLGSRYDGILQKVAVSIGPRDIFHLRSIFAALSSDGFADTKPLADLIARYVTPALLSAVAVEYAKGRVLLVGTTDLDARQPVVWDMGAIASSTNPGALTLFRQVLLASAAIPGVFPPVMLNVSESGRRYQEMHVDGGVTSQVFLFPPQLIRTLVRDRASPPRERTVYIIRNGRIDPIWQPVQRRSTTVAREAIDAFIDVQAVNDLYRLEVAAERNGERFNVAYIGSDFDFPHKGLFSSRYMHELFQYSYHLAKDGTPWHRTLRD